MEPIFYREMNPGEEQEVCGLVAQVFHEYVASDYEQDGVEEFLRFADPDAMKERMKSDGFVLVAQQADVLVGMLEFFPPDRIAMLFVAIQHQGIAKELLAHTTRKARSANPDLSKVTVHSSPYAEPIYLKMGFNKIGNARTEHGVMYIPMELKL
jgi:predicted GNAT family N-acyltransferase